MQARGTLSYDHIDKETRKFISDPSNHYRLRVITLYRALEQARERLKQSGKNIRPISQAMVNLIAGAGFLNQHYLDMLNSPKEFIAGMRRILKEQEALAMELGFNSGGFLELKKFLGVSNSFQDISLKIENRLLTDQVQTFRLRALSLQESPFRSCLGKDCTTWMHFKLGLHPSFLFFTLTDEYNRSSGQITVVLGYAKDHKGRWVKTAFVDNIHNVPLENIGPMLEGIRLSLSEHKYRLALSTLTKQRKKLSNEKIIKDYVNNEILPHLTFSLDHFQIDMPDLFRKEFYRDYDSIAMRAFEGLPVQQDNLFTITPGSKYLPKIIHEDLSIESFRKAFFELEKSTTKEHQMKFLENIPIFLSISGSYIDSKTIQNRLLNNIQDEEIAFSVRKRSLYDLFSFFPDIINVQFVKSLLNYSFTLKERKEILGERNKWRNIFIEQLKKANAPLPFVEFFIETLRMDIFQSTVIIDRIFFFARRDTLKLLINKGLDVNIKFNDGSTPLHVAVKKYFTSKKQEAMIRLLIESGADVNAKSDDGSTPLHVAVKKYFTSKKQEAMIQLLIESGADVNAREDTKGFSPLHVAITVNQTNIAQLLINNGADVNAKSDDGSTPLQLAVKKYFTSKKQEAMIQLLIESGADVNAREDTKGLVLFTLL